MWRQGTLWWRGFGIEFPIRKVIAYHRRRGQPKAGTDWRDIALLLLAFPTLKQESGAVADCLLAADVESGVMAEWRAFVGQDIQLPDDDDEF